MVGYTYPFSDKIYCLISDAIASLSLQPPLARFVTESQIIVADLIRAERNEIKSSQDVSTSST